MPKYILEEHKEEEKPVKVWLKHYIGGDVLLMVNNECIASLEEDGKLHIRRLLNPETITKLGVKTCEPRPWVREEFLEIIYDGFDREF